MLRGPIGKGRQAMLMTGQAREMALGQGNHLWTINGLPNQVETMPRCGLMKMKVKELRLELQP